ncbi:MAG TPA: FixH family protein [Bacteroidia bacterium]|nr:FixH family protein [Bacteroidia bacterium]HRS59435.1 FixH family protein [Bacteroidia bacterium]HRU68624.1 FixH family protein [Bacteroidia bacterium]
MKIKFNWGTGIILVILLFFGTLALRIYIAYQRTVDLVEKDYYPQGLDYQQEIDRIQNTRNLSSPIKVNMDGIKLSITFPVDFQGIAKNGELKLYRPSDPSLDLVFPFENDTSQSKIFQLSEAKKGKYVIQLSWSDSAKKYFFTQDLYIH